MVEFVLVLASTSNHGIGYKGNLPWHPKSLKADMSWFKALTTNGFFIDNTGQFTFPPSSTLKSTVIMGRKTWDSIPSKFKPLPARNNIVLSRSKKSSEWPDVTFITDISQISASTPTPCFVIGGAECYKIAIETGKVKYIFCTQITELHGNQFACDTFFPPIDPQLCIKTIDITAQVAECISDSIRLQTYRSELECFEECGVRYKMLVFILKQTN